MVWWRTAKKRRSGVRGPDDDGSGGGERWAPRRAAGVVASGGRGWRLGITPTCGAHLPARGREGEMTRAVLGLLGRKRVQNIINKIRFIPFINICYNVIKYSKKLEKKSITILSP